MLLRLLFLICLPLVLQAQQYPYSQLSSNGASRLEAQPHAPLRPCSRLGESQVWLNGTPLYQLPFYPEGPSFISNDAEWLILLPSQKGRIELWKRDSLYQSWSIPSKKQPWLYAYPFETPHQLSDFPEISDCPSCSDCATCKAILERHFEGDPKEWRYDFSDDSFCKKACNDPKTLFYEALSTRPAFCYRNAVYYFTLDHNLYRLPFGEKASPERFRSGEAALRWLKKRRLSLEGKGFNTSYCTYPEKGSLPLLRDGRSIAEALSQHFPGYKGQHLQIQHLQINQEGGCNKVELNATMQTEALLVFLEAQRYSTRQLPLLLSSYVFEGELQLR